jgi:hypothetical protein
MIHRLPVMALNMMALAIPHTPSTLRHYLDPSTLPPKVLDITPHVRFYSNNYIQLNGSERNSRYLRSRASYDTEGARQFPPPATYLRDGSSIIASCRQTPERDSNQLECKSLHLGNPTATSSTVASLQVTAIYPRNQPERASERNRYTINL